MTKLQLAMSCAWFESLHHPFDGRVRVGVKYKSSTRQPMMQMASQPMQQLSGFMSLDFMRLAHTWKP